MSIINTTQSEIPQQRGAFRFTKRCCFSSCAVFVAVIQIQHLLTLRTKETQLHRQKQTNKKQGGGGGGNRGGGGGGGGKKKGKRL